jgi:indolepyruvate ferredoxin oxidoreductase, alpha subunit
MKPMGEMLLRRFSEIVMGNTALVRAMVEAGTQVVTSYPGSPTPEIAAAIHPFPERRPFYFEFSTNEKVATEVAYGAAVNGHLSPSSLKAWGSTWRPTPSCSSALMNLHRRHDRRPGRRSRGQLLAERAGQPPLCPPEPIRP